METKAASLRSMKICRFCLSQDETLSSIYGKTIYSSSRNYLSLSVQIMACLTVECFPSDGLPCDICERCRFFIDNFYHFKQMCRQADERILLHIEDGTNNNLLPLQWPKKLSRLYNTLQSARKKSNKVKTVKTPSGATVQVQVTAANLMSDSEAEEEENTFKISIDENYHDDDPACIKVVKSSGQNQFPKVTNEQSFFNPITAQGEKKIFTCNICSKVFACYNYYTRHMHVRHKGQLMPSGPRGPFGEYELYRCDQCDEMFPSQDDLIYHSAQHATENLTCPLCQEKFQLVEEVSEHIKTHVDGAEFMCDLCELVFTTKEKLDQHLLDKHSEELRQEQELGLEDESTEEEEEEEDNIRIKEENGETVVELSQNFMDTTAGAEVTNSEESEPEAPPTVPPPMKVRKVEAPTPVKADDNKPVSILKKVEEMKRKSLQRQAPSPTRTPTPQKQAKPAAAAKKAESPSPAATADKSLRLLEKELQELQRTNTNRAENSKPPAKSTEPQRPKRSHTSTPKARPQEEKKLANSIKTPVPEKKPERRAATAAAVAAVTKENKEPKESKETKVTASKEDKVTDSETEKEKEPKETPNAKATPKNKGSDDNLRRSSRSGKVKDYAKMINEKSSDESTDDDEEYIEAPTRARKSNASAKGGSQPVSEDSPAATPGSARKRGRPRKGARQDAPPVKVMKEADDDSKHSDEDESEPVKSVAKEYSVTKVIKKVPEPLKETVVEDPPKSPAKETLSSEKKPEVIKSPSGQTLKKVPVRALPPGVKPLPLPSNARAVHPGELCEMQIGKKMVKVQKIVMTKAEVEAMAKKGLVEVKHGTMVLKQGIKLPTSDAASIKTTLMSEANKEQAEKTE